MIRDLPNSEHKKLKNTNGIFNTGALTPVFLDKNIETRKILPKMSYKFAKVNKANSFYDLADYSTVGTAIIIGNDVFIYDKELFCDPSKYTVNGEEDIAYYTRKHPTKTIEFSLAVRNCRRVVDGIFFALHYITKITKKMKVNDPKLPDLLEKKKKLAHMLITGCTYEDITEIVHKDVLEKYHEKSVQYRNKLRKRHQKVTKFKAICKKIDNILLAPIKKLKRLKLHTKSKKETDKIIEKERIKAIKNKKNNEFVL